MSESNPESSTNSPETRNSTAGPRLFVWASILAWLKRFKEDQTVIAAGLGAIIGIVGGGLLVFETITTHARNAVLDETFLRRLASEVRPSCIFDSKGTLLADQGLESKYLEHIQVERL